MSQIYREKIVPLIDSYCSQLSLPDAIDKINRLELDLGNIDLNNLEQDLIKKVEVQIQQQLTKEINSNELSFSAKERSPETTSNSEPLERSLSSNSDLNSQKRSPEANSNSESLERSPETTSNSESLERSRDPLWRRRSL